MERMDTDISSPPMKSDGTDSDTKVIFGHRVCQTRDGIWLCITDIYGKLHRPNIYDIGGTYIDNVPDFWFTFKTERSHGLFLLHLFAGNHMEGTHSVGISTDTLVYTDKDQIVRMTGDIETYKLDCKANNQSYITTIPFKNADVEDVLKGKTLYIGVRATVKEKKKNYNVDDVVKSVKMHHDNLALLMDPVGADFIIESQDGDEFPVHKSVLSLHSDVFKAMLHEDMAESRTGRVKLVDVASEDLRIMLEYIYTSTISVIENINFPHIIMLADRYNLLGLRRLCDHILIDQLAPDTALDILVLADRFDCSYVKNKALQYIKHNKANFKDAKFDQIDNMALLKEICTGFLL